MRGIGLLHDPLRQQAVEREILPLLAGREVHCRPYPGPGLPDWPPGTLVLAYLGDAALADLIPEMAARQWRVGLLPHPGLVQVRLGLGVPQRLEDALHDALNAEEPFAIDLLHCNGRPVFHAVVIGDAFTLLGGGRKERLRERIARHARFLPRLGQMLLRPYTLATGQDKSVATAAVGIVVVEHGESSIAARHVLENANINDGMLNALILAPRSVLEMFLYLVRSAFSQDPRAGKLPAFVGHIKSAELRVSSPRPMEYTHDGAWTSARELHFTVAPRALLLLPGRHLNVQDGPVESRESFRVQSLPSGEARTELIYKPLPFLHQATTEEFRDLFQSLRENARPRPAYLTLMVLSTLLATIGLFANSTPVIIGAMILAPLMAPIISLAMALARQDERLMFDAAKTLAWGVALALASAVVATWLIPLRSPTPEITARLSPTLLDLGVAAIAGIAGAYAHAREEVAKGLAGVAIAVALVPPLAVAGIGLGWADWHVLSGAMLLFLTNLFGIVLTASLTFLALGFAPFRRARRGLLVSLALVALISLPLALGFVQMARESAIIRALDGWETHGVTIRNVTVRHHGDPLELSVRLLSPRVVDGPLVERVKSAIEERIGRTVHIEATSAISR